MDIAFDGLPPSLALPHKGGGDEKCNGELISDSSGAETPSTIPSLPPLWGKVRKGGGKRSNLSKSARLF